MQTGDLYEEKILSKWKIGTFALITAVLLFLLLYQLLSGPIGKHPAPNWFFLFMFLLFFCLTINFSRLSIRITSRYISVRYGIFKRQVLLENIEDCYLDRGLAFRYGGWGIRLAKVKGKWRLVYNIMGIPLVVLLLKKGKLREFLFATKNHDNVIEMIRKGSGII